MATDFLDKHSSIYGCFAGTISVLDRDVFDIYFIHYYQKGCARARALSLSLSPSLSLSLFLFLSVCVCVCLSLSLQFGE